MRLYRRLLHALDNYGVRALRPPAPPASGSAYTPNAPHPFDLAHGVDTSGYIPGGSLETGCPADLYNTAYYAISPSTLIQALKACPVAPSEYTFLDLGCGKGRALLVAAEFGFAQSLGVEISPELATIAKANTASEPSIQVLVQNATSVRYPAGPRLIFLYHPFLGPVLRRTISNLLQQTAGGFPSTYLLFANPSYDRLLARFPRLVPVWSRIFPLSEEDAAADRHGITEERYALYLLAS